MAQQSTARIAGTIVLPCSCHSEFQDGFYGKDKRLHNNAKENKARCSNCGNMKAVGSQQKEQAAVAEEKKAEAQTAKPTKRSGKKAKK